MQLKLRVSKWPQGVKKVRGAHFRASVFWFSLYIFSHFVIGNGWVWQEEWFLSLSISKVVCTCSQLGADCPIWSLSHHQHRNQYCDDHHNDHKQSSSPSISLSLCTHAPNQWRSVQSDHSHQQHHNQHQYDQSNHLLILLFTCWRICTTAKVWWNYLRHLYQPWELSFEAMQNGK